MDIPLIIAFLILTAIAAAEIILLLRCPKAEPFPLTILIRSSNADVESRLQYMAYLLARQDCIVGKIVLISDCADEEKNKICSRFAEKFNESAIFISEKDENFLQKIIDFAEEI